MGRPVSTRQKHLIIKDGLTGHAGVASAGRLGHHGATSTVPAGGRMQHVARHRLRLRRPAALAALLALAGVVSLAASASTRVYRCTEAGRVIYTDVPCKDAAVVDLPADRAAPDAVERLRRDQQMLDAAAAERRSRVAQEDAARAAQRAQSQAERDAMLAQQASVDAATPYGVYDGIYVVDSPRRRPVLGPRPTPHREPVRAPKYVPVPPLVHQPLVR
jgi:hypothetical protein